MSVEGFKNQLTQMSNGATGEVHGQFSNQEASLPQFVEIEDFRVVREDGFRLQADFREKGVSALDAVSIVSYTYYLRVPLEEYMEDIKILDAGSLTGGFKKALATLGSKAEVTNLDHNLASSVHVKAEIEHLPFAENSFDKSIASWAIPDVITEDNSPSFMADEIRELYRITKEGGTVYFVPIKMFYVGAKESKGRIEEQNYENVIQLLHQIRKDNPGVKIKVTRMYVNSYADAPEHDKDYFELLQITK